jgi:threonine/homoserine/homoserine lactone efflux protein
MTFSALLGLFAAMVILAAVPSTSVAAVAGRAATAGFAHGAATAAGIVVADILFILLAIFGLAALAQASGTALAVLRVLGGAYLVAMGVALWRSASSSARADADNGTAPLRPSHAASFMAGLFITLGDQNAIIFYLGFLPAFVDLDHVTWHEILALIGVTVLALGGVKLVYAWLAVRAGRALGAGTGGAIMRVAAAMMGAVGCFLIVTAWV